MPGNLSALGIGGGVKRIQSGTALAAGTVAITAVTVAKSFVISVSKGSDGFVAARGTVTLAPTNGGPGSTTSITTSNSGGGAPSYSGSISGGTTDLTTKQYSAKLTSSTQLTVDGPCEWQVIEHF
jgi:hypothetical protein